MHPTSRPSASDVERTRTIATGHERGSDSDPLPEGVVERLLAEPSALDRLRVDFGRTAPLLAASPRREGLSGGLEETADAARFRREALGLEAPFDGNDFPGERDSVIEITRGCCDSPKPSHNDEEHHDEKDRPGRRGSGGGDGIAGPNTRSLGVPIAVSGPLTWRFGTTATIDLPSAGTTRATAPSLGAIEASPFALSPGVLARLIRTLPTPLAAIIALGFPQDAGDVRIYGFPVASEWQDEKRSRRCHSCQSG